MTPAQKPDDDPFQSKEYAKFVASMAKHCHCYESNRPCDGVLAGGVCDGMKEPERERDEDES